MNMSRVIFETREFRGRSKIKPPYFYRIPLVFILKERTSFEEAIYLEESGK